MQRGTKLKNPNTKKLANTFKECVDGATTALVQLPNDFPVAPVWLSDGARDVWAADLERVIACGAREVDSNMLALYCETMASFIASVKAGETPNAAFRSELRKMLELLGIAGAKSRLAKVGQDTPASNPFAKFK